MVGTIQQKTTPVPASELNMKKNMGLQRSFFIVLVMVIITLFDTLM